MVSLAKKIGNSLRGIPLIYAFASRVYTMLRIIFFYLHDFYIRILELLAPRGYFIQSTPDFIASSYKIYLNDAKKYHSDQQVPHRDYVRLIHGKYLLDMVYNLTEGDYAELGTYKGQFARFIFEHKHPSSSLYCFDTFEGFHESDVAIEQDKVNILVREGFFSDTSLELVRNKILAGKRNSDQLVLVKGYFPSTFKGFEEKKWRFVQLDADLYEPMKEGVKLFWPNIVNGGILLIHDYYGGYLGTKKAIDSYFEPLGLTPVPLGDKAGTAVLIKGR